MQPYVLKLQLNNDLIDAKRAVTKPTESEK